MIPRYCPLEVPPTLCSRGCGMGPCERAVQGLQADVAAHGETIDGRPYTVNRAAFEECLVLSQESEEDIQKVVDFGVNPSRETLAAAGFIDVSDEYRAALASFLDIPARELADDDCEECFGDGLAAWCDGGDRALTCEFCNGTGKWPEATT